MNLAVEMCRPFILEALRIYPGVVEPTLAAPLPAGRQAMAQWQAGLPVVVTHRLAQQHSGHHPAKEHEMTPVGNWTVLMGEGDQLTRFQEDLDWFRSPTISWLLPQLMG